MIETIMSHVAIWMPSLVAILGVLGTLCVFVSKVSNAIFTIKNDKDFMEMRKELKCAQAEMRQLKRTNDLLLTKLTNIKDYSKLKQDGE